MEKTMSLFGLAVIGVFLWLLASTGEAATTWPCNCASPGVTIQSVINNASVVSGDTILVSGICNENVDVYKSVIIDGSGSLTTEIHGLAPDQPTVKIRAGSVTIKNFHSIQGGQDGIYVSVCGPTILNNTIQNTGRDGVFVFAGTNPTINGNIIQTNTRHGIDLYAGSFATIINNTITANTNNGIYIGENSAGRIGFSSGSDPAASFNTITNNGGIGIQVYESSSARIVGNTISGNTSHGVQVSKLSHADIADNTIEDNQQHGIYVSAGSGVNLGNGSGTTIFDLPNYTNAGHFNLKWGISYAVGAYVSGRLGNLNGVNGASGSSGIGITTSSLSDAADESGIDVNGNMGITGDINVKGKLIIR
jgi:parallel beta-helix repeat protein